MNGQMKKKDMLQCITHSQCLWMRILICLRLILSAVRAKAYDIVLNGTEIGGGSVRIHQADVQSRMFKALGLTDEVANEKFGFLLDAFKYGVPPHAGLAYGLDRLVMLMAKRDSIRDVIAFPKVKGCILSPY